MEKTRWFNLIILIGSFGYMICLTVSNFHEFLIIRSMLDNEKTSLKAKYVHPWLFRVHNAKTVHLGYLCIFVDCAFKNREKEYAKYISPAHLLCAQVISNMIYVFIIKDSLYLHQTVVSTGIQQQLRVMGAEITQTKVN